MLAALRTDELAPPPVDERRLQRAHGRARLVFEASGGRTRLATLQQTAPCRVLLPRPANDDLPIAVLVTTCGGLAGGDRAVTELAAGPDASALITAQAAEKIYRSLGADTRVETVVDVARGAWLEWLPQETILFDGARLRRSADLDVARGGRLLAGEFLVFGRRARGERLTHGALHDRWRVRRDGRLVWTDTLHLSGDLAPLRARAGLDGAEALAMVLYVADDAGEQVELAREFLGDGVRAGVTAVGDVLIARFLGTAQSVRRGMGVFWQRFRAAVAGLPARLPRIWHV